MRKSNAPDEVMMEPLLDEDPSEYGPTIGRERGSLRERAFNALPQPALLAIGVALLLIIPTLSLQLFGRPPRHPVPSRFSSDIESCLLCGPNDDLCNKWGSRVLTRGRSYQGSGEQLAPFLEKVRSGQDVRIGIIGGSISACIDSELDACYHYLMARKLEKDWGINVEIVNGALSAVGSDFFASCWSMAFAEQIDLFILELAVNDEGRGKENRDFDVLVRALLEHEWHPSIVVLSMYSPLHPWTNGAPGIESIAQYYDLPVISHRNVIVQQRHLHNSIEEIRPWFATGGSIEHPSWPGGHHPGPRAHELTGDLLVSYLREQMCTPAITISGKQDLSLPPDVSPWTPYQWPDDNPAEPTSEFKCFTAAPGDVHFPIAESHGFKLDKWKAKEYLVGYNVGDRIVFNLTVTHGKASIMYWRSKTLGFGRARFWLDGEEDKGAWIWGDWDSRDNVPVRHDVHTDRNGERQMIVEINESTGTGKHEFRISAVIA